MHCVFADPLKEMMISESGFRNALYMIDIGQNDIADSFSKGLSYSRVIKLIPNVISEIKSAIKVRTFTSRSQKLIKSLKKKEVG